MGIAQFGFNPKKPGAHSLHRGLPVYRDPQVSHLVPVNLFGLQAHVPLPSQFKSRDPSELHEQSEKYDNKKRIKKRYMINGGGVGGAGALPSTK